MALQHSALHTSACLSVKKYDTAPRLLIEFCKPYIRLPSKTLHY